MLGNDHGPFHAAKVALYVAALAKKLRLDKTQTCFLQLSAIIHDYGRIGNCDEPSHGKRSVEEIKALGIVLPDPVVEIVELHSVSDKKLKKAINNNLCSIFKDADALDRVRTNDLDVSYLRTEEAKSLIAFAQRIEECLLIANE